MVKRITLFILAFAVAAAVVFTGCAPARRPYDANQGNNVGFNTGAGTNLGGDYNNYTKGGDIRGIRDNGTGFYNTGLNDGRVGNQFGNFNGNNPAGYNGTALGNNENTGNANTQTRRTDQLARACEQVPGVDNATVVVTGNTAYVGIDLDENMNVTNDVDIRNQVVQKIRAAGDDINTVYVSAEPDFMDRIKNVGNGLRNGRPIDAFTTELREMIQRVTPTRW